MGDIAVPNRFDIFDSEVDVYTPCIWGRSGDQFAIGAAAFLLAFKPLPGDELTDEPLLPKAATLLEYEPEAPVLFEDLRDWAKEHRGADAFQIGAALFLPQTVRMAICGVPSVEWVRVGVAVPTAEQAAGHMKRTGIVPSGVLHIAADDWRLVIMCRRDLRAPEFKLPVSGTVH